MREWRLFRLKGFGPQFARSRDSCAGDLAAFVCVCARARRNAALECGRGRRGGQPALGVMAAASFVWYWVALRPASGRGPTSGPLAGERLGKRAEWASCSSGASFRRPSRSSPVSAGQALRPRRPRFRSGKFCDAEFSGRAGSNGPLRSRWLWALEMVKDLEQPFPPYLLQIVTGNLADGHALFFWGGWVPWVV